MNKIVKFNKLCADYGILAAYAFGSGAEKAVELIEGRETEGHLPAPPGCKSYYYRVGKQRGSWLS